MSAAPNRDEQVVAGFGEEWAAFDQTGMSAAERQSLFSEYFAVFPWHELPDGAVGADIGCGSGRWATLVAPRVGHLHCLDPSDEALEVARRNLAGASNVTMHAADVGTLPFAPGSLDFAYSLGVLHHVPDTLAGLRACARALKPGAPFLVYLYYAFDNQPGWYRGVWRLSDLLRRRLCSAPFRTRLLASTAVAALVYLPLSRLARLLEIAGRDVTSVPLSYYRRRSFYTMRNDALDRFGTSLERRFTQAEIRAMLQSAGFRAIEFSDRPPYWTAVARRTGTTPVHAH